MPARPFLPAAALALFLPAAAAAAEVRLAYPVIGRLMAEQVFTQEGRKYVAGAREKRCDFAYLETPAAGEWNGQLIVKARFSGRKGLDVLGRCVGLGDAFDLTVAATPLVKRGKLVLSEVHIDTGGKDSFYIRRVRKALAESLEKEFSLDIAARARELLEDLSPATHYRRELTTFELRQVKVTKESIVLDVDFALTVR
ncbi:MAG: hypothetical protein HY821_16265 [Acidobacteria bacterium]|nr:hypothetical protein [Acidobacteriota bacterium]